MGSLKAKALLLSLIDEMNIKGSWTGETHIQKVVYFLQKASSVPFEYDFILYKHGPFSFELRDELAEMMANDFVKVIPQGSYGSSYKTGKLSSTLKEMFSKTIEKYSSLLSVVSEKISTYGVDDLEKLSTALYVCKEENITNQIICAQRINILKPHISQEEAKNKFLIVQDFLKQIKEQTV